MQNSQILFQFIQLILNFSTFPGVTVEQVF